MFLYQKKILFQIIKTMCTMCRNVDGIQFIKYDKSVHSKEGFPTHTHTPHPHPRL